MATHSRVLAWRIAWAEEPGGLQFMGSQRGGHHYTTGYTPLEMRGAEGVGANPPVAGQAVGPPASLSASSGARAFVCEWF